MPELSLRSPQVRRVGLVSTRFWPLEDGERFGREPGFDGVRAERAERERDRGGKHPQTGVHRLASSLSTIETTKLR